MSATIVHEDAAVRQATWEGVFFEVWRGVAQPQHFRDSSRRQLAYAATQPGRKMALMSVVRMSNISSFDKATRQELELRSKLIDPLLLASAVVLPAPGFAASLVRGVLTGLSVMSMIKVRTKIAGTTQEACDWMAPLLPPRAGRPISAGELLRVCEPLLG